MRKRYRNILVLALVICIPLVPALTWFGVEAPAHSGYYRLFGSHVVMALGQATFEGIREQVIVLWKQMNATFAGHDYDVTYNTPFYWDQNYDNSLRAQQDYFRMLIQRIDSYIVQYNQLKVSSGTSLLEDWYDKSMRNLRDEMDRMGGLDWAIWGVWYLKYAPTAYWADFLYLIPAEMTVLAMIVVVAYEVIEAEDEETWQYHQKEKRRKSHTPAPDNHIEIEVTQIPRTVLLQNVLDLTDDEAKKLSKLGITEASRLCYISPSYLTQELNISRERADEIIKRANKGE